MTILTSNICSTFDSFPMFVLCTEVHGVLPITVQRVKGPVIKGFGRGSKILGIPTGKHRQKQDIKA